MLSTVWASKSIAGQHRSVKDGLAGPGVVLSSAELSCLHYSGVGRELKLRPQV